MNTNGKFSEFNSTKIAVASADIDTSDVTGAVYYDVRNFKRIFAKARTFTDLTVGKILTMTLMQATDASGTSAKAIGSAYTSTAAGTAKVEVEADILASALDIDNSFYFVGVKLGSDLGSAVVAAAAVVLSESGNAPVV